MLKATFLQKVAFLFFFAKLGQLLVLWYYTSQLSAKIAVVAHLSYNNHANKLTTLLASNGLTANLVRPFDVLATRSLIEAQLVANK